MFKFKQICVMALWSVVLISCWSGHSMAVDSIDVVVHIDEFTITDDNFWEPGALVEPYFKFKIGLLYFYSIITNNSKHILSL